MDLDFNLLKSRRTEKNKFVVHYEAGVLELLGENWDLGDVKFLILEVFLSSAVGNMEVLG